MRERVEMVGGRFGIESAPGQGTTITAVIADGKAARNGSSGNNSNHAKFLPI